MGNHSPIKGGKSGHANNPFFLSPHTTPRGRFSAETVTDSDQPTSSYDQRTPPKLETLIDQEYGNSGLFRTSDMCIKTRDQKRMLCRVEEVESRDPDLPLSINPYRAKTKNPFDPLSKLPARVKNGVSRYGMLKLAQEKWGTLSQTARSRRRPLVPGSTHPSPTGLESPHRRPTTRKTGPPPKFPWDRRIRTPRVCSTRLRRQSSRRRRELR